MKIIKTYDWNRRDFSATLKCESCNHVQENSSCYDDSNYYDNVIPSIKCNGCGKSSKELGTEILQTQPKYDPNITM